MITLDQIHQTRAALGEQVRTTPTWRWRGPELSALIGEQTAVHAKLELLQYTGTFKIRGALNVARHLTAEQLDRGIVTISAGNHAIAAAFVAKTLGVSVKVVMVSSANPLRVSRCKALGAEVISIDDIGEGFALVEQIQKEEGRFFLHPFEGMHTSLGCATVGLELSEQAGALDAVIVPIGGGGLASGVAAAIKLLQPSCAVYGVEPEGAPTMTASFAAGGPTRIGRITTIADSLGAPFSGPVSYALCRQHLDEVVLVNDDQLRSAQALAFGELKLALEPAGAASTAALLGPLRERLRGQRVGIIICGSNIDVASLATQIAGARPFL